MTRIKGLTVVIGSAALLMAVMACGNGEANVTESEAEVESAANELVASLSELAPIVQPEPAAPSYSDQVSGAQLGIWVTGQGRLSLEPDLALVNIGVEAMADTVAEARDEAATAMAAVVAAVKSQGLTDKDVQTRSFNIWPQYEYSEVVERGVRVRKQTLVGYTVSNTASIKVRDMDEVGVIIDEVAAAGGDNTRVNGIDFTVEDPTPHMTGLREAAVKDALAKAAHLAELTGVSVGALTYIAEVGSGTPVVQDFQEAAFAKAAAAPAAVTTSISGGELDLSLRVQAAFRIQ